MPVGRFSQELVVRSRFCEQRVLGRIAPRAFVTEDLFAAIDAQAYTRMANRNRADAEGFDRARSRRRTDPSEDQASRRGDRGAAAPTLRRAPPGQSPGGTPPRISWEDRSSGGTE